MRLKIRKFKLQTTENKDKLTQLAEILLDKEVIFKDDLQRIFGDRPHHKNNGEEKKLTDQSPEEVQGSQNSQANNETFPDNSENVSPKN